VEQAVLEAMRKYGANPGRSGHTMSLNTALKVYECREAAANLFGAGEPENVVFTSNCTHAINLAVKGVLDQGDHVIISDLEHNSVLRPIHTLAEQGFISYSVAAVCDTPDETVASFAGHIQPSTKMIVCTHGSNVWGIQTPIKHLGRLAKDHGLLFLVDAAQTAGVVDIDMSECHIDFLCMAGHKSLYGPSGTGLLITPLGNILRTVIEGGTGTMSADYSQPFDMPERLECGTVNTMGIVGLRAGIDYVTEKSIDTIYGHEMKLGRYIYDRLTNMDGVILYTKGFEKGRHLPVISFNAAGLSSEEVTSRLSDMGFALRGGLHCAPLAHKKMGTEEIGAARISIGAFNNMTQTRQLCDAIERVTMKRG
jgi:cysteine desulfurase family protein